MSASVIRMADWSSVVKGDYGLWVAGYPDNRDSWDIPKFLWNVSPWPFYAIWQYRKNRLTAAGYDYNAVQNIVNQRLAGTSTAQNCPAVCYTVQKSDTPWGIAQKYGTTYQEIARLSGIADPDKIWPGQKVRVK